MMTNVTVLGNYADDDVDQVNVFFETTVRHRKDATKDEILAKAVATMIVYLTPLHPDGIQRLSKFSVSEMVTIKP